MATAGEVVEGHGQRLALGIAQGFGVMVALVAVRTASGEVHCFAGHGGPVWWVFVRGALPALDRHRGQSVTTAGPRRDESYLTP